MMGHHWYVVGVIMPHDSTHRQSKPSLVVYVECLPCHLHHQPHHRSYRYYLLVNILDVRWNGSYRWKCYRLGSVSPRVLVNVGLSAKGLVGRAKVWGGEEVRWLGSVW